MPTNKEIRFFDRSWGAGPQWYAEQFAGGENAVAVGEGTPYMSDARAAERIGSLIPDCKLVAVLRNPVERTYSHYQFNCGWKTESRSFEDALAAERRGEEDAQPYLADSRYLPQLERFTEHFPRDQLSVVLLEDLMDTPTEAFRSICSFVGVRSDAVPENVGTAYNSAYRIRSFRFWFVQRKYQDRIRLPKRVGAFIHNRLNKVPVTYDPMSEDLRSELVAEFAEHNDALARWLGRDLSHWSK